MYSNCHIYNVHKYLPLNMHSAFCIISFTCDLEDIIVMNNKKKTRYNIRELGIDLLLNYAHNLRFQGKLH